MRFKRDTIMRGRRFIARPADRRSVTGLVDDDPQSVFHALDRVSLISRTGRVHGRPSLMQRPRGTEFGAEQQLAQHAEGLTLHMNNRHFERPAAQRLEERVHLVHARRVEEPHPRKVQTDVL